MLLHKADQAPKTLRACAVDRQVVEIWPIQKEFRQHRIGEVAFFRTRALFLIVGIYPKLFWVASSTLGPTLDSLVAQSRNRKHANCDLGPQLVSGNSSVSPMLADEAEIDDLLLAEKH